MNIYTVSSFYKKHANLLVIVTFVILSWLSVILLLNTHSLMGTGDMPMHLHQLREIQLALNHHELVYYGLNEFHGSAIMTLYPWLNLWPAAVLTDLIKDKVMAIYLFFVLNELLVFLISYFSSLNFSKSKRISYLFAVFYGLSTLYLDYGFADMDWGELLTMTFLPLVIFGSVALLQHGDWLELSAGMTLIIYSHVLNTLLISFFLIIFFLINVFKIRIRTVINLIKAILLTVFATVVVWLPALKLLYFNRNVTTPPKDLLYGTPFRQIIDGAIKGEITYGVSFFALGGAILGALFFLTLNRYTKQLYIISALIVIMCSAWFPWYLAPQSLTTLQFTWRLYLIPELWLSYVSAKAFVYTIKQWHFEPLLVFIGLLMIALGIQFESQYQLIKINGAAPVFNDNYLMHVNKPYAQDRKTGTRYFMTWMLKHPHGTIKTPENYRIEGNRSYDALFDQRRFLKMDNHYWPMIAKIHYNDINNHYIRSDQGLISRLYVNGYHHFTFTNRQAMTRAFMPLLDYNGERLQIKLDGHPIPNHSRQNVLFIDRIAKGHHEMSVNVVKDQPYEISLITLFTGLVIYIILLIIKILKFKKR